MSTQPSSLWGLPFRSQGAWGKESEIEHYCSFPTSLTARIIELTSDPGDLVLDPFAGSGVALAQAQVMGRHFVGFELNDKYIRMFEEVVKREVAVEWAEMETWRKSQVDAKIDFEQTIMKLRALKYTRQATKPFIAVNEILNRQPVRAILCNAQIPSHFQPGQPFTIQILALVESQCGDVQNALQNSIERTLHPPLTQYGIQSELRIVTCEELSQDSDLLETTYYLYSQYKPRSYVANGPLSKWLRDGSIAEYADRTKVPLLANVGVDVAWVLEKYLE